MEKEAKKNEEKRREIEYLFGGGDGQASLSMISRLMSTLRPNFIVCLFKCNEVHGSMCAFCTTVITIRLLNLLQASF
jgi:hypothetical protein